MNGPNVRFGTKWPSITSRCSRSAPAVGHVGDVLGQGRVKSALSSEGATYDGAAICSVSGTRQPAQAALLWGCAGLRRGCLRSERCWAESRSVRSYFTSAPARSPPPSDDLPRPVQQACRGGRACAPGRAAAGSASTRSTLAPLYSSVPAPAFWARHHRIGDAAATDAQGPAQPKVLPLQGDLGLAERQPGQTRAGLRPAGRCSKGLRSRTIRPPRMLCAFGATASGPGSCLRGWSGARRVPQHLDRPGSEPVAGPGPAPCGAHAAHVGHGHDLVLVDDRRQHHEVDADSSRATAGQTDQPDHEQEQEFPQLHEFAFSLDACV